MGTADPQHIFGPASRCTSLPEALEVITKNAASSDIRRRAAAFAMVLSARQAIGPGRSFHNTRAVLDTLARAKAEIDIAAWHSPEVVTSTSAILAAAQRHLDENTFPCTEWPFPSEIAGIVEQEAQRLASPSESTNLKP